MMNAEELISRIFKAFEGVSLSNGVSLIETEYADGGQIAPKHLVEDEEKNDWTQIINDRLCDYTVTFSFIDYKGFRFYIAPYMVWSIQNYDKSDSIISDFTVYAIDPSSHIFDEKQFEEVFTIEQIEAMRDFLLFASQRDDYFDSKIALRRLKRLKNKYTELNKSA